MKRMFTMLTVMTLLFSGVSAQQSFNVRSARHGAFQSRQHMQPRNDVRAWTIKLDSITSESFSLSWTYNAEGKITQELFIDKFEPSYNWREVATFDSAGNIIRNDIYSWIDNAWFLGSYEEFEYNALGQRVQRINANYISGAWQIGGRGFYTYNATGQLLQYLQQIHVGGGVFDDLSKDDYCYATDGKLEKVNYFFYNAGWDSSYKDIITYNGDLVSTYTGLEYNGFGWDNGSKYEWMYSAANNAVERDYFIPSGATTWSTVQDKYIFRYDEGAGSSDILFPLGSGYFSNDYQWFTMNHKRTDQDWHTVDMDTQILTFVEVETYHYSSAATIGIPADQRINEVKIFPNPAEDVVHIQWPAGKEKCNLEITDLSGKIVSSELITMGQDIRVSELPAGCYFVTLSDESGIIGRTKLIRK